MSTAPTFTWTPTVDDYVAALRLWRSASGGAARTRMVGATLLALGFVTVLFSISVLKSLPMALVPLVAIVGIGVVWFKDLPAFIGLRQSVRSTPAMLQPLRVVVDKKGITASNPSGSERFPWSSFAAYVEGPDLMLLGLSVDSPAAVGILRRDAASDPAAWAAATSLIRSNVPVHPRVAHLRGRRGA